MQALTILEVLERFTSFTARVAIVTSVLTLLKDQTEASSDRNQFIAFTLK